MRYFIVHLHRLLSSGVAAGSAGRSIGRCPTRRGNAVVVADRGDNPARRVRRRKPRRLRRPPRRIGRMIAVDGGAGGRLPSAASGRPARSSFEARAAASASDRDRRPVIVAMWHGQAFLLPLRPAASRPVDVLVSRHSDGELMARTLHKLGCGTDPRLRLRRSGAMRSRRAASRGSSRCRQRSAQGRSVVHDRRFPSQRNAPGRPRHDHAGAGQRPADRPGRPSPPAGAS